MGDRGWDALGHDRTTGLACLQPVETQMSMNAPQLLRVGLTF